MKDPSGLHFVVLYATPETMTVQFQDGTIQEIVYNLMPGDEIPAVGTFFKVNGKSDDSNASTYTVH